MIHLIVAVSENGVIGKDGELPWVIPSDMKRFRELTLGNTVIMGSNTFRSIGRALPNRQNIVLTRGRLRIDTDAVWCHNLEEALAKAETSEIFIIGGAELYKEALPYIDRAHVTVVHTTCEGDTYFDISQFKKDNWKDVKTTCTQREKDEFNFTFHTYMRERSKMDVVTLAALLHNEILDPSEYVNPYLSRACMTHYGFPLKALLLRIHRSGKVPDHVTEPLPVRPVKLPKELRQGYGVSYPNHKVSNSGYLLSDGSVNIAIQDKEGRKNIHNVQGVNLKNLEDGKVCKDVFEHTFNSNVYLAHRVIERAIEIYRARHISDLVMG